MKIRLPKFIRRRQMQKEFKKKCLHTFPCQCCAYYKHRGKDRDKCGLGELLLEKYDLN